MRILHLNLEPGWRGGERQTLLTLQGLQARGHEVALAARRPGALAERAQAAGIPVLGCAGGPGLARCLWLRRKSDQILHAQTAQTMSVLALMRPWLSGAVVFTRRTAFASRRAARHRWKWSRADGLVAISAAAASAPRALGLPVEVIASAVEPLPVDPERVAHLRAQHRLQGRRVVVTTAALSPEKDPVTLVEAVDRLRRSHPDVICLHCGAEGAAADHARARVRDLDLQAYYRFLGFEPHVGDVLALAELYVSSSRVEALGSSLLDACLAGLPVVATEAGGQPEILGSDRGLLVPVGDAAALAQQMGWLLDHPLPARAMAARARAHVAACYAVPAMVQRYEALYLSLLERPARPAREA